MGGGGNREGFLANFGSKGRGLLWRGLNRAFTVFAIIFLHLTLKSFLKLLQHITKVS